mmetsp:Transcript_39726/g.66303  ORF Transcript_39726/g.66303 Transcript_39726/m.66303 type:complete len:93 (-) Transcript_39726:37-315(-)
MTPTVQHMYTFIIERIRIINVNYEDRSPNADSVTSTTQESAIFTYAQPGQPGPAHARQLIGKRRTRRASVPMFLTYIQGNHPTNTSHTTFAN